jgi:hypothetical protein
MPDRHDTPVMFSRAEMREIREVLGRDEEPQCPNCTGPLTIQGPLAASSAQGPVWSVKCDECHRAAFITEVPGSRTPEAEG